MGPGFAWNYVLAVKGTDAAHKYPGEIPLMWEEIKAENIWLQRRGRSCASRPLTQQRGRLGGAGSTLCSRTFVAQRVLVPHVGLWTSAGRGSWKQLQAARHHLAQHGLAAKENRAKQLTVISQHTSCGSKSPKPRKIILSCCFQLGDLSDTKHFQVLAYS